MIALLKKFKAKNLTAKPNLLSGFSLIELLIVSSIFALITSIIMIRFSLFNNRILTTNLAYDIALSIRQAQTFGINVRGVDSGPGTIFSAGYGLYFASGNKTEYVFFADNNNNKKYESSELLETLRLFGGYAIKDICAESLGASYCFLDGGLPNLSIVFTRPEPDASLKSFGPSRTYEKASLVVTSPQGDERTVDVYLTGQISIRQN